MIELQKRLDAIERRCPVTVIDLQNDPDANQATQYIINVFGKDRYLYICEQAQIGKTYWLVIDPYHADYWLYKNFDDVITEYCNFSMFGKEDKSTFPYWFAHWCAFQLTALNLKIWKFKYLFHDFEKPWMRLFMPYKKVQKWHRTHNNHHLEYGLIHGFDKIDWEALMIDWECSRFSKKQCPLNCREELENKLSNEKWKPYAKTIRKYLEPILNAYFM